MKKIFSIIMVAVLAGAGIYNLYRIQPDDSQSPIITTNPKKDALLNDKAEQIEPHSPNTVANTNEPDAADSGQTNVEKNIEQFKQRLSQYNPPFPLAELLRPEPKDHLQVRKALVSALNAKDWAKALQLVQSLTGTHFETHAIDATLSTALGYKAPIEVVVTLLDLGGELPANAINLLIFSADLAMTQALMNYGLDINYVDGAGLNAIENLVYFNAQFAFDINQQKDMLQLLIDNGVSITSTGSQTGLDALSYALMNVQASDAAVLYAQFLIQSGAVITLNHMHQLTALKINNETSYNALIARVPELEVELESKVD